MPLPPPPPLAGQLDNTSDSKLCEDICTQPVLRVGQIDVRCNWMMHRRTMSPQTHYGRPQQRKANPTSKPKQALNVINTPFACQHGSQLLVHCGGRWTHATSKRCQRRKTSLLNLPYPLIINKPFLLLIGNIAPGQK